MTKNVMFFESWPSLLRVVIVGVLAYVALLVLLRVSGKRTLSRMNALDVVITVALGSSLAMMLLSKEVALLEGITAFALLIFLQYLVAWLSVRSQRISDLVKAEPKLLFHGGKFLSDAMKAEGVTKEEVCAAIRSRDVANVDEVRAVVLETDGSFTVTKKRT